MVNVILFKNAYNITFNTKKTMGIKYGEPVKDSKKITLDQVQLEYYNNNNNNNSLFQTLVHIHNQT